MSGHKFSEDRLLRYTGCKMNKITCYCCDRTAFGQGDHVPPKKIFAKGTFSNIKPIIVPSCEEHNQQSSKADEYLKFILSASSKETPPDVLQSTVRGIMRYVNNNSMVLRKYGIDRNGNEVSMDGTAPIDHDLLDQALGKIARGIYHHHHERKKKLLGNLYIFPIFLGIDPDATPEERKRLIHIEAIANQDKAKYETYGDFKEVFSYQVIESEKLITINMQFYGNKMASVISECSATNR